MKTFKDSKWLITGGSSGLGLELARLLVADGARVAIVARGQTRLLAAALGTGAIAIEGDVSSKQDTYKIAGQARAALGSVDYLVNGASALGPAQLKLLADTDCEELETALATNVLGAFRLTKAIAGGMLLAGHGTVVNISSDAAVNPYATWGAYGASKAALDLLTKIWAEEVRTMGVTFLSVDPGDMDTPLHEQALPGADRSALKSPALAARQLLARLLEQPVSGERLSL